jgi:hypothetical protein
MRIDEIFPYWLVDKILRDFQLKKYPKISCGAGILGLSLSKGRSMPMPQDWIIFFVEFSNDIKPKY